MNHICVSETKTEKRQYNKSDRQNFGARVASQILDNISNDFLRILNQYCFWIQWRKGTVYFLLIYSQKLKGFETAELEHNSFEQTSLIWKLGWTLMES